MTIGHNYGWNSERHPASCSYVGPAILKILDGLTPTRVLDLGSGNGALCRELAATGRYEVVGVEPDAAGVAIARAQGFNVQFYQLGVGDEPHSMLRNYPGGFDAVVSTEVIEHLYSPRQLVAFAHSVLRDRGHLLLTTPYHGYVKNIAIALANGWDRHADPLWDGGHIKFWSRKTMTRLVDEGGFKTISFGGVGRVPYLWKSMVVVAQKR